MLAGGAFDRRAPVDPTVHQNRVNGLHGKPELTGDLAWGRTACGATWPSRSGWGSSAS